MNWHFGWRPMLKALRTFAAREFILVASITALSGSAWLFLVVSEEVCENGPHPAEKQFMRSLRRVDDPWQPIGPDWVKPLSIDITALGSVSVLTVLTLLAVGSLFWERRSGAAVFVLVTTIGGTALNEGLKSLFARERPDVVPHLATFNNTS